MPVEIRVPSTLGESVIEATVGKWLKQVGDQVAEGETVVELETDKVNLEVPAENAGVLEQISKETGTVVGVGEVLGTLATNGAAPVTAVPAAPVQTTRAATPPPESAPSGAAEPSGNEADAVARAPITPLARKLATENKVDLSQVRGSGIGGRITREDVAVVREQAAAPVTNAPADTASTMPQALPPAQPHQVATEPPLVVTEDTRGREQRVRMSRRRQTIARRLVEAQHTAAMLTTFNEVDMSAIMEVRKRRRDAFKERHGVGLGFMSFFTKAAIGALKAFPRLNAEIQGDEMVLESHYDIGIAVSADEGLVVPVVRDADRKSFAQIEREIADLAARARNNSLTLAELQGGTFTITNGGIFGSLLSTPILNTPQVGILGMHKIQERPIAVDGQVVIRPLMYLALSYDHRIVDGSEAVRFLVRIKELLEDPEALLLEG